jgi:hypothetical protein
MKVRFKEFFHLPLTKVFQSRLLFLAVFDSGNSEDIVSNQHHGRLVLQRGTVGKHVPLGVSGCAKNAGSYSLNSVIFCSIISRFGI